MLSSARNPMKYNAVPVSVSPPQVCPGRGRRGVCYRDVGGEPGGKRNYMLTPKKIQRLTRFSLSIHDHHPSMFTCLAFCQKTMWTDSRLILHHLLFPVGMCYGVIRLCSGSGTACRRVRSFSRLGRCCGRRSRSPAPGRHCRMGASER